MPTVAETMANDRRLVRKWGAKILGVTDYATAVPADLKGTDGKPVFPATMRDIGLLTPDGLQVATAVSSSTVMADQYITPVRSDVDSIEKTWVVTFEESNAWVKALANGVPFADWPTERDHASDTHDGDFVDFPYLKLYVFAQDGVGDQTFYHVEVAYMAKVNNLGGRTLARANADTRQITFMLFQDPTVGRSTREVDFGPGYQQFHPPTGADAGTPGTFTPAGSLAPASLAALQAGAVVANPATAWTTGQSVDLYDGTAAHWSGTAWVAGVAA